MTGTDEVLDVATFEVVIADDIAGLTACYGKRADDLVGVHVGLLCVDGDVELTGEISRITD